MIKYLNFNYVLNISVKFSDSRRLNVDVNVCVCYGYFVNTKILNENLIGWVGWGGGGG